APAPTAPAAPVAGPTPTAAPPEPVTTADPAVNNAVAVQGAAMIETQAPAVASIPVPAPPPGADSRAKARWLLATAREQIRAGNYDEAAANIAKARAVNTRWGLFDDT